MPRLSLLLNNHLTVNAHNEWGTRSRHRSANPFLKLHFKLKTQFTWSATVNSTSDKIICRDSTKTHREKKISGTMEKAVGETEPVSNFFTEIQNSWSEAYMTRLVRLRGEVVGNPFFAVSVVGLVMVWGTWPFVNSKMKKSKRVSYRWLGFREFLKLHLSFLFLSNIMLSFTKIASSTSKKAEEKIMESGLGVFFILRTLDILKEGLTGSWLKFSELVMMDDYLHYDSRKGFIVKMMPAGVVVKDEDGYQTLILNSALASGKCRISHFLRRNMTIKVTMFRFCFKDLMITVRKIRHMIKKRFKSFLAENEEPTVCFLTRRQGLTGFITLSYSLMSCKMMDKVVRIEELMQYQIGKLIKEDSELLDNLYQLELLEMSVN